MTDRHSSSISLDLTDANEKMVLTALPLGPGPASAPVEVEEEVAAGAVATEFLAVLACHRVSLTRSRLHRAGSMTIKGMTYGAIFVVVGEEKP